MGVANLLLRPHGGYIEISGIGETEGSEDGASPDPTIDKPPTHFQHILESTRVVYNAVGAIRYRSSAAIIAHPYYIVGAARHIGVLVGFCL